jgi:uncharacterized protein YkwD
MKSVKLGIAILVCLISLHFNSEILANCFTVQSKNVDYYDEEQKIFELVNKERIKRGLDNLSWNSKLADLARNYSQKMAKENFFDHIDNNGDSIAERVNAWRITKWKKIGENLFMSAGYDDFSKIAIKGWMKSRGHRENILDENYNETGIGIARSKSGMIYVTQIFMKK